MEITLVTCRYRPPHYRGGLDRYVDTVGRHLVRLGESVNVVAFEEPLIKASTSLPATYVSVPGLPYLNTAAFYRRSKSLWTGKDIVAVQYAHLGLSVPTAQLVPTVQTTCLGEARSLAATSQGIKPLLRSLSLRTQGAFLEGTVYRRAPALIAINAYVRDHLIAEYKVAANRITVIGNGVDTDEFAPADHGSQRDPSARRKALYVGRLHPRKNVPLLLHTLKRTRAQVDLTVVGEGPELPSLKKLCSDLQLDSRVSFAGRKTGQDLLRAYQSADIFLMPSVYEGMPLSVLEAKACGLPVLSADFQGVKEVVAEATGFIEQPDEFAFARALERLATMDLEEMRRRTRMDCLARFSWASKVSQVLDVYREVCQRQRIQN